MGDNLLHYSGANDSGGTGFESAVLIEETVVWDENAGTHFIVGNSDSVHQLKAEMVSQSHSYMTPDDEEYDETRYFSILDSNVKDESFLPDISSIALEARTDSDDLTVNHFISSDQADSLQLVIENPDILDTNMSSLNNTMIEDNNDVLLYKMEGTDDLYAIQTADDGNGNMQRYQFKVRLTEMGQYEAVPGTIEVQSDDSPLIQALNQTESNETTQSEIAIAAAPIEEEPSIDKHLNTPLNINIKEESLNTNRLEPSHSMLPTLDTDYLHDEPEEHEYHLVVNEDHSASIHANPTDNNEYSNPMFVTENIVEETGERILTIHRENNTANGQGASKTQNDNTVANEQTQDINNEICLEQHQSQHDDQDQSSELEHYTMAHDNDEEAEQVEYLDEAYQENDYEEEEYQTVEGIHITGDSDDPNDMNAEHYDEDEMEMEEYEGENDNVNNDNRQQQHEGNARMAFVNVNSNDFQKVKYDYKQTESNDIPHAFLKKDNVSYFLMKPQQKLTPNPRSLLKKTFATSTPLPRNFQNQIQQHHLEEEMEFDSEDLPQITIFPTPKVNSVPKVNILNKTNKSVVVPQPVKNQVRQPRKQAITPVERFDSEIIVQEVTFAGNNILTFGNFLLPKKRLNPNEIYQISDSDDDYSPLKAKRHKKHKKKSKMIEITISDSEDDSVVEVALTENDVNKENIAGNAKRRNTPEISSEESITSPPKRKRGRPPKGSKNFVESNGNDTEILEKAFSCARCSESFKTKFLLVKHEEVHKKVTVATTATAATRFIGPFKCNLCSKTFSTADILNAHKKLHLKQKLALASCPPVKVSPKASVIRSKGPSTFQCYKCTVCLKTFTSAQLLDAHKKIHLTFTCTNCTQTFTSKYLFTNHVRQFCVKSPARKRVAKASQSANKPLAVTGTTANLKPPPPPPLLKTPVKQCPQCGKEFRSHTDLYRHQRIVHENCAQIDFTSKIKQSTNSKKNVKYSGIPFIPKRKTLFGSKDTS